MPDADAANTLPTAYNLADCLSSQGKRAEVAVLLQEVLAAERRTRATRTRWGQQQGWQQVQTAVRGAVGTQWARRRGCWWHAQPDLPLRPAQSKAFALFGAPMIMMDGE